MRLENVEPSPATMVQMCKPLESKKYLDEEQVKGIWDFVLSCMGEENKMNAGVDVSVDAEPVFMPPAAEYEDEDGERDSNGSNVLRFESDMFHHYYPSRRSLYNRKQHFTSFIQNYLTFDQGRKIMSDYEQQVCDFIMKEMKPASAFDFLCMMKECKLSNVYRFYGYIFVQQSCKARNVKRQVSIKVEDIHRIIFVYAQFELFFNRNDRFNRKNFLSMRFVLGRILVLLGIVSDVDHLDIDLQRPKGKTQLKFHLLVWKKFIDETYNNKVK